MLTAQGVNEIAECISGLIGSGKYDLDGVSKDTPIYKISVEDNRIMIYLYFEDELSGSLSNFKLISKKGNEFAMKPEVIVKPNTKGLLVRFTFEVKEG